MLLLATIISILFVTCHCGNSTICVERGHLGALRGPYKHIGFNDSLDGDVYEFSRPHGTLYLYPYIVNTDYYWFISGTLHSSMAYEHCYIGNVATLGSNYLFDINDCQYWMYFSNPSGWQSDGDMKVSICQFDDICIEDSIYLTYLNTNYRYIYWNYTVNGAVYYNEISNKYVYPYLLAVGNQTNAKYVIGDEVGVGDAKAYCEIGTGVPWYYVFDFDHCLHYKSWWQSQWTDEPNMSVTNCSTDQPTPSPTFNPTEPTASPTANPTINPTESTLDPTRDPTQHPATSVPTFDPTSVPTIEPTVSTADATFITITETVTSSISTAFIVMIVLMALCCFITINICAYVYLKHRAQMKMSKNKDLSFPSAENKKDEISVEGPSETFRYRDEDIVKEINQSINNTPCIVEHADMDIVKIIYQSTNNTPGVHLHAEHKLHNDMDIVEIINQSINNTSGVVEDVDVDIVEIINVTKMLMEYKDEGKTVENHSKNVYNY